MGPVGCLGSSGFGACYEALSVEHPGDDSQRSQVDDKQPDRE
jgi:hypothetical protein